MPVVNSPVRQDTCYIKRLRDLAANQSARRDRTSISRKARSCSCVSWRRMTEAGHHQISSPRLRPKLHSMPPPSRRLPPTSPHPKSLMRSEATRFCPSFSRSLHPTAPRRMLCAISAGASARFGISHSHDQTVDRTSFDTRNVLRRPN
jgi:hypothetical protein